MIYMYICKGSHKKCPIQIQKIFLNLNFTIPQPANKNRNLTDFQNKNLSIIITDNHDVISTVIDNNPACNDKCNGKW